MTNPACTQALAREHYRDLCRAAAVHSSPHLVRHRPRPQPRQRVGWLLIEVGLRLTVATR